MPATGDRRALPTEAEMSLVIVAGYESELRIQSVEARRRMHTTGILIGIAVLVFGYDFLSVALRH
jgi:hypothetical protein